MELGAPILEGRPPIGGYGRGLFRLGGIEHRGSLIILPEGVFPWPVTEASEIGETALAPILERAASAGFLLLGTGAVQHFPQPQLRAAFAARSLALEAMDTGAACRTYNILLAEERLFSAALIAIP